MIYMFGDRKVAMMGRKNCKNCFFSLHSCLWVMGTISFLSLLSFISFISFMTFSQSSYGQTGRQADPCLNGKKQTEKTAEKMSEFFYDFAEVFNRPSAYSNKNVPIPAEISKEFYGLWNILHSDLMSDLKNRELYKLTLSPQGDYDLVKRGRPRTKSSIKNLVKRLIPLMRKATPKEWELLNTFLNNDKTLKSKLSPEIKSEISKSFENAILDQVKREKNNVYLPEAFFIQDQVKMEKQSSDSGPNDKKMLVVQKKVLIELIQSEKTFYENTKALGSMNWDQLASQNKIGLEMENMGKKLSALATILSELSLVMIRKLDPLVTDFLQDGYFPPMAEGLKEIYMSPLWRKYMKILYDYINLYQKTLEVYSKLKEDKKSSIDKNAAVQRKQNMAKDPFISQILNEKILENDPSLFDPRAEKDLLAERLDYILTNTRLNDLAITPVQRAPRHELLLRELLKNTGTFDLSYSEMEMTYKMVVENNLKMNQLKKYSDSLEVYEP